MTTPLLRTLLAILAVPTLAQAQAVDGRRIKPGSDSLMMYAVSATDTSRIGLIQDRISVVKENGEERLFRVYRSSDRLMGNTLDTIVDARTSLVPVRYTRAAAIGGGHVEFANGQARGTATPMGNTAAQPIEMSVAVGAINASTFDLWVRAAPLAEGYASQVTVVDPATLTTTTATMRVDGRETIDGESSWRVSATMGPLPVTFWVGESTRKLRKQFIQLGTGAGVLFTSTPLGFDAAPRVSAGMPARGPITAPGVSRAPSVGKSYLLGAALGGAGLAIGSLVGKNSTCDALETGHWCSRRFVGAAIGSTIGMALGVHLGDNRRGNLLNNALIGGAVWSTGILLGGSSAWKTRTVLPSAIAMPIVQLLSTVAMERMVGREKDFKRGLCVSVMPDMRGGWMLSGSLALH